MKLPRKGCMVRATGEIYWAFEHTDPNTEFDSMPPFMIDADGTIRSLAAPADLILDLEQVALEPGDMDLLVRDMPLARCRKQDDGTWKFTTVSDADGTEVEHPMETRIKARKEAKAKKEGTL